MVSESEREALAGVTCPFCGHSLFMAHANWDDRCGHIGCRCVTSRADILAATVERLANARADTAVRAALSEAASDLERRAGEFKHLPGDRHVRRTHNDIAAWLRKRAAIPKTTPTAQATPAGGSERRRPHGGSSPQPDVKPRRSEPTGHRERTSTERLAMNTSEVLNRAADLIERVGLWKCDGGAGTGTCASNAIVDASGRSNHPAHDALIAYLGATNDLIGIFRWNDAPERTAAEVIEVLRAAAAIEAAKETAVERESVSA